MKRWVILVVALAAIPGAHADQMSELRAALSSSQFDRADALLVANPALIEQRSTNWPPATPLTAAVWEDNCAAIAFLLGRGAQVSVRTWDGYNVLSEAARRDKTNALQTLLVYPVSTNVLSEAFGLALGCDKPEAVSCILSFTNHVAALKTAKTLFFHGLVRVPPPPGSSFVPRRERVTMIRLLRENGFDPSLTNRNGKTAADIAAENRDIDTLRVLDVPGKYNALLSAFIPATNSPFIGRWSSEKDNPRMVAIELAADGRAVLPFASDDYSVYWSQVREKAELYFPPNQDGSPAYGSVTLRHTPTNDTMTLIRALGAEWRSETVLYRETTKGERHAAEVYPGRPESGEAQEE